ncbi:MAG: signal peptidase II [Candidatus Omnitrophica bacterium]|nr:signal peptidase II [Candidatus Omnitrophota bacterium]
MKTDPKPHLDIFLSLFIVSSFVCIDRLTKIFFTHTLSSGESFVVLRNILHMTLVHNPGIAFGMFKNHGIVFIIIPVIMIGLLVFNFYHYKYNNEKLSRLYVVSVSLILAGAIGNLIDRILYGYVIDFIDVRVFPVFNVADSAITVGACLLLWRIYVPSKESKE